MNWSRFFRRRHWAAERARELEAYLEAETAENVERGMSAPEARAAARRRLGNLTRIQEEIYGMNSIACIEDLLQDLRYALRALRTNPGFALLAVLSLGLGMGANTAFFTLINALMLKPLPVAHPEQLVQLTMGEPRRQWFSNPIWEEIRGRRDAFSGVFAYARWRFNLAPGGEAKYVQGHYVSGQFFETLDVRPALGRVLTASDDRPGCPGAAVLSYGMWQREYGGRTDVLGKSISLNGYPIAVVGVAEPGFTGLDVGTPAGVMVPLCAEDLIRVHPKNILATNALPQATGVYGWLKIIGRLQPEVSAAQAAARLNAAAPEIFRATLPRNWPPDNQAAYLRGSFEARPTGHGQSDFRNEYRRALGVLMAISGIVLLIACTNLSSLLLARGVAREREIATRMALGAGCSRLVRQLLTETLLLAGLGTLLGVLFAGWGVAVLVRFLNVSLDLRPDLRVLAFNTAVAAITGLVVGLAPAWRGSRVQPVQAMKADGRGTAGDSRFALRKLLVVMQVSLAVVLLAGAGLLLSTFRNLRSVDPGFQAENVLLAKVDFRNGNQGRERPVWTMLEALRSVPGVKAAAISSARPLCGCEWSAAVAVDGRPGETEVLMEQVSEDYFQTLGTGIVAGRDFNRLDTPASRPVALINQSAAARLFAGVNPLGRYLRKRSGNAPGRPVEIVGIVKDSKFGFLREERAPVIYMAERQDTQAGSYYQFELRSTGGDPAALIPGVKSAVGRLDPRAVLEFSTLSRRVSESISREQLLATLSGLFGGLALLLTAVGLYGLMSYHVARRRREIGIRMALGAGFASVLRTVMGETAILAAAGLACGIGLALGATRLIAGFLYGVTPADPFTLAAAAAVVAGVTCMAGYLQARRALRLDPVAALRE